MYFCKPNDDICLILTNSWQPFGLTSARESIKKIMSSETRKRSNIKAIDKSGNLHTFNSWVNNGLYFDDQPYLRSANKPFAVPTILITNSNYFYKPKIRRVTLKMLYIHFKGICQICGKKKNIIEMTKEHIKPISKGGTNDNDNISLTCRSCNAKKDSIFPYLTNNGKEIPCFNGDIQPLKLIRSEWKIFTKKY